MIIKLNNNLAEKVQNGLYNMEILIDELLKIEGFELIHNTKSFDNLVFRNNPLEIKLNLNKMQFDINIIKTKVLIRL